MDRILEIEHVPGSRAVQYDDHVDILGVPRRLEPERLRRIQAFNRANGSNAIKHYPGRYSINRRLLSPLSTIRATVDTTDIRVADFVRRVQQRQLINIDNFPGRFGINVANPIMLNVPDSMEAHEFNFELHTTNVAQLSQEGNEIPHIIQEIESFRNFSFQEKAAYIDSLVYEPNWVNRELQIVFNRETKVRNFDTFCASVSQRAGLRCTFRFENTLIKSNLEYVVTTLSRYSQIVHFVLVHPSIRTTLSNFTIGRNTTNLFGLLNSNLKFSRLTIGELGFPLRIEDAIQFRVSILTIIGNVRFIRFPNVEKELRLQNISRFPDNIPRAVPTVTVTNDVAEPLLPSIVQHIEVQNPRWNRFQLRAGDMRNELRELRNVLEASNIEHNL